MQSLFLRASVLLVFFLLPLSETSYQHLTSTATTATCADSSPASAAYIVTVCLSAPFDGSTLTGLTTVSATVSVSGGTSPGVQRMVFYLDGAYLLTDYESPYNFSLPTTRWVDGIHSLAIEALMRDTFTSQQATISVTFSNGVTSIPGNNNQFQPTSGRTPVDGAPFIVAAAGDGASGEVNAGKVSDLINSLNPNLFLYLGDVYEKGSPTEFYNWYGTPSTYFGRLRSITDPTIGNHEYQNRQAPGYFDYWDNIPNYYSYDANGWHFISLNSNSSKIQVGATSAQYKWLQDDLSALPSNKCIIVYYHHPLFDIGPEGPTTAMADIWNLLAQYGVDIVLNGHDHDYQRWMPLDGNGQPKADGVTEFVAGAAGHSMETILGSDSRVAYSNSMNPGAFGVLLLQLNQKGANFTYLNTSKSALDSGVVPCVPAGTDSQAPTTPGGFSANLSTLARVDLSWTASTDDVGVAGYTIYRDGVTIASVPASQLAYSDTTVAASTTYTYFVDAFDPAGNHSSLTAPVSITTNYVLTITSMNGTVNRDKPGPYHYGDVVQLTAVADAGWSFANWSGDITGTNNPSSITINSGKSVTANYTQNVYTLTVTSAHGTVNRDNTGPYHYGDVVQLTATPNAGWSFAKWSGDVTSTSNPVSITMNGNKSVTANYAALVYTISGSAGVAGATITYTGGSTISDDSGNYSFGVPYGWSGTIIPSKTGYIFLPVNLSYSSVVANQTGQNFTAYPLATLSLRSTGLKDGWVLESGETSGVGGSLNTTDPTFNLGDDAANRQYRVILSFKTAGLPDTAVITSVMLEIRRAGVAGTKLFAKLGPLVVDIKAGAFKNNSALQIADFQAAASANAALTITNTPVGGWYSSALAPTDFVDINKAGLTQFRLRFSKGDNNNHIANYIKFYSGNSGTAANKPTLTITYYVP